MCTQYIKWKFKLKKWFQKEASSFPRLDIVNVSTYLVTVSPPWVWWAWETIMERWKLWAVFGKAIYSRLICLGITQEIIYLDKVHRKNITNDLIRFDKLSSGLQYAFITHDHKKLWCTLPLWPPWGEMYVDLSFIWRNATEMDVIIRQPTAADRNEYINLWFISVANSASFKMVNNFFLLVSSAF